MTQEAHTDQSTTAPPSAKSTSKSTPTLLVLGAGPKGIALAAKRHMLAKLGYPVPNLHIIDRQGIASHWSGQAGYTDGNQYLGTRPEKDVGFPYLSACWGDKALSRAVAKKMVLLSWQSYLISSLRCSDELHHQIIHKSRKLLPFRSNRHCIKPKVRTWRQRTPRVRGMGTSGNSAARDGLAIVPYRQRVRQTKTEGNTQLSPVHQFKGQMMNVVVAFLKQRQDMMVRVHMQPALLRTNCIRQLEAQHIDVPLDSLIKIARRRRGCLERVIPSRDGVR